MDEARLYRRALGAFATGVVVVAVDGPDGPLGITVNSFTSVSLKPRLVLWCLDEASDRFAAFVGASRFGLTVLAAGDEARSSRFAGGAEHRIEGADLERFASGAPALSGGIARFAARTVETRTLGDHAVIVGEIVDYVATRGAGLTYFRGRYGLAPDPEG